MAWKHIQNLQYIMFHLSIIDWKYNFLFKTQLNALFGVPKCPPTPNTWHDKIFHGKSIFWRQSSWRQIAATAPVTGNGCGCWIIVVYTVVVYTSHRTRRRGGGGGAFIVGESVDAKLRSGTLGHLEHNGDA